MFKHSQMRLNLRKFKLKLYICTNYPARKETLFPFHCCVFYRFCWTNLFLVGRTGRKGGSQRGEIRLLLRLIPPDDIRNTNAIAKKLRRSVVIEEHFGGFSQPWYLRSWLATLSRLRISFLCILPFLLDKPFPSGADRAVWAYVVASCVYLCLF